MYVLNLSNYTYLTDCLQILGRMTNKDHLDSPDTVNKIIGRIQERAASGFELPRGWLFKGLVFYFNRESDTESSKVDFQRLSMASNIVRFAGAAVVSSLADSSITHVITDPDILSAERNALRESLSTRGRRKVPHIVTSNWIEECWGEETLLDEESKFLFTISVLFLADSFCRVSTSQMRFVGAWPKPFISSKGVCSVAYLNYYYPWN